MGLRPPDLALSSCSLVLHSSPSCPGGVCAEASVWVTAVQDFLRDPDTQNLVEVEVTGGCDGLLRAQVWPGEESSDWAGYRSAPVVVVVEDLATPSCQVC